MKYPPRPGFYKENYSAKMDWLPLEDAKDREAKGDIIKEVHVFTNVKKNKQIKLYGFKREK